MSQVAHEMWREKLGESIDPSIYKQIENFHSQILLKKQGKFDEKLFAETRLRLGLYGQRYDNGQRYDGEKTREIMFPNDPLTKGPETKWDAPGMVRVKIPFGKVTSEQMEVMAELSEEYSDGVSHITTRQDIQLHFIHIEDCPSLMTRLAGVGITTQEACGNSVRNVTACAISGVCKTEAFDVQPYADAIYRFLLGHPDTADFGRKLKIAFSGCADKPCALVGLHDLGLVARVKNIDGKEVKGFKVLVGGGLGAVPHDAKTLHEFLPVEELLPLSQAICRIFGRLGEKANRALARIKFLVAKLGIEEFGRLVVEERKVMRTDPRWLEFIENLNIEVVNPMNEASSSQQTVPEGYAAWHEDSVEDQKQKGFSAITVRVPLGDLSADQMRGLADVMRIFCGTSARFSIEQNFILRWVPNEKLIDLYTDLVKIGLGESGAQSIADITTCPGTDTCKLGTSSSRGLAWELQKRLDKKLENLDPATKALKVKISGCYNACGQHSISHIGFYGVTRKKDGRSMPFFQVVLGGKFSQDQDPYGFPIAAIPSHAVPDFLDKITDDFVSEKKKEENFNQYITRLGKATVRKKIEPFMAPPTFEDRPDYYYDWGSPRIYSTGDKGTGECAGEIVSLFEQDVAVGDREVFEAQIAHEAGDIAKGFTLAQQAMISAAKSLVKMQYRDVLPEEILPEFFARYRDTGLFKKNFSDYLSASLELKEGEVDAEKVKRLLQETYLFIEETYRCHDRVPAHLTEQGVK